MNPCRDDVTTGIERLLDHAHQFFQDCDHDQDHDHQNDTGAVVMRDLHLECILKRRIMGLLLIPMTR